jgi:NO-binding membrane sensor protein with MHYT domain
MSLWLMFLFREDALGQFLRKVASVVLRGAAIAVMHYTAYAIYREISEHKQAEAALRQKNERLQMLSRRLFQVQEASSFSRTWPLNE